MASILVNPAAITALQALRVSQAALGKAQQEVSTGQKISNAAANASTWAVAASMKSDKAVLSTINQSLDLANSILGVAAVAVRNTIGVMDQIKAGVVQAMQPGADTAKILTNLGQLGKQLTSIVSSSTFAGVNVLDTSQINPLQIVSSYSNGQGGNSNVQYIQLPLSTLIDNLGGHFGMVEAAQGANVAAPTDFTALTNGDLSSTTIADTLTNADKALSDLIGYASIIGVTQTRVMRQRDFMKTMEEALSTGISALIDADMNETSTRIQALQTQQQLGVQSLSIANQNAKMILKLFE